MNPQQAAFELDLYGYTVLPSVISQGEAEDLARQIDAADARIGVDYSYDEAFARLFPVLTRQIKLVWQARAAIEAASNLSQPSTQLKNALLSKPNLGTERDWAQQQALRLARKTTFARLATCYLEVVKAEAALKGIGSGSSPMETLEQMVLRMAAA